MRRFFVAALVGWGLVVGGMVAATVTSDVQNKDAARTERDAIRAALSVEVDSVADRLRAFAAMTPLAAPAERVMRRPGPFSRLYLVDPNFPASAAASDPVAAVVGRWNLPELDASQPEKPRSEILAAGDHDYLAVALPGAGRAASSYLVALEPLDEAILARLARRAGTKPIATAPTASAQRAASGEQLPMTEAMALSWTADRPGDRFFRAASAVLACLAAVFACLALVLSRRMTRALAKSEAQAQSDASHDLLTGLSNRSVFSRELQRETERVAKGMSAGFALISLDIDRFKDVNDTYGHTAGDTVIITAAQRIAHSLRAGSRVSRIGGDEFAILMTDFREPSDCAALARRIVALFQEPIQLGASKAHVSTSIGIALCPHDSQTMDGMINSADLALYRAKNEGRNRFCFFEQRMGEELRMRKTVEDDLRYAIENDQLLMEYQPIVSLDGRKLIGVESLVRWRHPTQGTISPASFITLAEECGLILPLGEWVLRQALCEARRWPGLKVAVNVSAIQFRQKDFVATVQRLLDESGVEPGQLELELTESVLLADADQAEDAMIELRAMGVRLALDDFGTGYSSLIYLRRFAFDKIKIDKSFLESTESTGESAIIVHSIVHLGRALGLTVTAEGVETQEQHRFLQALGCHELQGFLFSPPVAPAEIDARLGLVPERLRSVA